MASRLVSLFIGAALVVTGCHVVTGLSDKVGDDGSDDDDGGAGAGAQGAGGDSSSSMMSGGGGVMSQGGGGAAPGPCDNGCTIDCCAQKLGECNAGAIAIQKCTEDPNLRECLCGIDTSTTAICDTEMTTCFEKQCFNNTDCTESPNGECVMPDGVCKAPCCETSTYPGCLETQCETCVCAADSFCCSNFWDAMCLMGAEMTCPTECNCPIQV